MRIRKTSQYIEGGASISNVYGTSQENGYSQEYCNANFTNPNYPKLVASPSTQNNLNFTFTDTSAQDHCYLVVASKWRTDASFGGMFFIRRGLTNAITVATTVSGATMTATATDANTISCTFSSNSNATYSEIKVYRIL